MIKINLLPVKAAKKRGTGQKQLVVFLLLFVALLAVLFFMYQGKQSQLQTVVNSRMEIEKEIAKHKQYIKDLEKFKAQKAALEQKLEVIKSLRQNKETPVTYLEEISRLIPNKVWLEGLKNAGGSIVISGWATDHQDIATFMSALQQSKFFVNVKLSSIKRDEVSMPGMAKSPILQFDLNCTLTAEAKKG